MKKIYSQISKVFLMTSIAVLSSAGMFQAKAATTLAANTQPVGNICPGAVNAVIHSFTINTGTGTPNLTQILESIGGTWIGAGTDVTNFKLYYTTTNAFATTNLIQTINTPATGNQTFNFVTPPGFVASTTYYFWITADVPLTAGNRTLIPAAMTNASFISSNTPESGTAVAGNTKTIVVRPTVSISPSAATVCSGSSSTLTASGTLISTYLWSTAQTSSAITVNPVSATTYTVTVTSSAGCTRTATQLISITAPVNPTFTSSSIPADVGGVITICPGNNVSFTTSATATNGTQTYQWYNNLGAIAGATSSTYSSTGLGAFPWDVIFCIMTVYPNGTTYCPSGTSFNSTTYNVGYYATPGQPNTITGLSPVCANQTGIAYSTTGAVGATSYSWSITNGSITSGPPAAAIVVSATAVSPMTITVYGVNTCGVLSTIPRTRNIVVNPLVAPAAVTIADASGGPTAICQYLVVDFSATISEASLSKVATWKVDGVPMFTSAANTNPAYFTYPNAGSYSYPFVNPGVHTVTCDISYPGQPAPGQCYSPNVVTSNTLSFTVTQNEHAAVSITSTMDTNHFCRGSLDVFTATAIDAGTGPFTWYVDGVPDLSSTTAIFNYIPLTAGSHFIYCVVRSDQHCDSMAPVSNPPVFYDLEAYSNIQFVNVDPCTYYVPVSGNLGPYNACGGIFYDSQTDPLANYANNQSGTVTFCSALPSQFVAITFTSMALADNGDILRLYSGVGTGGPLLQTFTGPITTSSFCGAVVSQDVSAGCITAQFQTNSAGTAAGWVGNISCSPTSSVTPAGVNCANPTIIAVLPYTATGHTTQCFLNDYTNQAGICNATYNGEDRVYRYDALGPECTSIMMSGCVGSPALPALSVYQGCPGAGGICLTTTPMVGNNSMQFTFPGAGTYYIIVDETSGYSSYTLTIQSFGLAPLNDLPCNSQYIDLSVWVNGNTSCTGSALEPAVPPATCVGIATYVNWTAGNINAAWHYFIAPASGSVKIRTSSGTIGSTQIALYSLSGSCSVPANYSLLACNRIGPYCNAPNPLITSSEIAINGLTPATNYYIRVDGINANTGNYSIIVVDQAGPQPYVAGQDCIVPLPVCTHQLSIPSPGFYNTGWVCDFATGNNSCLSSGELNSLWLVFTTNGTGFLNWKLTPYGVSPPATDYDWMLMDITGFGVDQTSRVAAACASINSNIIPFVRCNLTGAGASFPTCCTNNYCTGMCPSAAGPTSPPSGSSYNTQYPVVAGQTFLLFLMNHWQNNVGFNIDFDAFGVSPIPSAMPSVVFWTGTVSTDWFNASNWGNCGPPNCNTTAIVYSGATNYPAIAAGLVASCKNLDIRSGASLTMLGSAQLDLCGNFVNNGSLISSPTALLNVINSSAQYLDGIMTGSNSFGSIAMSKSAAAASKLTLLDNVNMSGTLILANTAFGGKILTGTQELYITNSVASASNFGSPTSYVEGNLRRNLNGLLSSSGPYYFPVGHATSGWQLATLDFTSTHTIPNILGNFTPWSGLPGPMNLVDGSCSNNYNTVPGFYNNGYWMLTASANATSANYDLQLRNANVSNGPGLAYTVAKAATSAGPWSFSGSCTPNVFPFAKRTGMNGFSAFATAQGGALPVSLLSFDAVPEAAHVLVTWTTASEINNDFFIVERSADGEHFEKITTRKGAGNSSVTLYYSINDNNPLKGVSYYRLRQVDFDGTESESEIVAVKFLDDNVLNVFPVPTYNTIGFEFASSADGIVKLEIVDMLGKTVYSRAVNVTKGFNKFENEKGVDIEFLPHGIYIMQVKPVSGNIVEPMQKRFLKQIKQD